MKQDCKGCKASKSEVSGNK